MTFTVKTTKRNVNGAPPSVDPTGYFVPGIGLPAKSTADYYHMGGTYGVCPWLDLDQCGSAGAAVKAANGGLRYPWLFSANHPNFGYGWLDSDHFMLGFSSDPAIFPTSLRPVLPHGATFSTPNHPTYNFQLYEEPYLIYNPADTTGRPFWLYAEVGQEHWSALFTSPDLVDWVRIEIAHDHDINLSDWSSFQHIFDITPGAWKSVGLIENNTDPNLTFPHYGLWTSSDGITWTPPTVGIVGTQFREDASGRNSQIGDVFATGGATYAIVRENTAGRNPGTQNVSIVQCNPVTIDLPYPWTGQTIAGYAGVFPGPTFLNDVRSYREDGIAHLYASVGFASEVNTTAGLAGPHGAPYSRGGGLVEEFIDYFAVIYDAAAAAQAAPCGVQASCNDGVVLINWDDTLPNNTYRLYRGSSASSQTTLIGDVTGTFYPDNPTLNQMWWYKLVTLQSGIERKSRVVHTYASSASSLINRHMTRLIDDGGA